MRAELYTTAFCPFCVRAKQILDKHGVGYVEHKMDGKPDELRSAKRKYGHETVPIILIDGEFIGGCDELEMLERTHGLERS
jgi:glutaredoxin 3